MAPRISRARPYVSVLEAGVVRHEHVDNLGPREPESRPERRILPTIPSAVLGAAFDEMARSDPEFLEWRRSERLGDLFGRNPR